MHSDFRRYVCLALVLLLAVTSQSMAVARGTSTPAGQMELCTGTGPVMVYVDEDGTPAKAPHFCPDCALTLLVHVPDPNMDPQLVWTSRRLTVVHTVRQIVRHSLPRPQARAPPSAA